MTATTHGKHLEATVRDHEPIRLTWYVVDCKCGWQSPLCTSRDHAQRLYEAHCGGRLGPD